MNERARELDESLAQAIDEVNAALEMTVTEVSFPEFDVVEAEEPTPERTPLFDTSEPRLEGTLHLKGHKVYGMP